MQRFYRSCETHARLRWNRGNSRRIKHLQDFLLAGLLRACVSQTGQDSGRETNVGETGRDGEKTGEITE